MPLTKGNGLSLSKQREWAWPGLKIKHTTAAEREHSGRGKMAVQLGSVLITGANRGLGLEMVQQMVEAPRAVQRVFACCRDPDGPKAEVRGFKLLCGCLSPSTNIW